MVKETKRQRLEYLLKVTQLEVKEVGSTPRKSGARACVLNQYALLSDSLHGSECL